MFPNLNKSSCEAGVMCHLVAQIGNTKILKWKNLVCPSQRSGEFILATQYGQVGEFPIALFFFRNVAREELEF